MMNNDTKSHRHYAVGLMAAIFMLSIGLMFCADSGSGFRAAVVKVNITPDQPTWFTAYQTRQSEGVHDSLYHKIVVMDDGHTQFILISSDLSIIGPSFYHEFCRELEKDTEITETQVWWAQTHTHAAPMVGPRDLLTITRPWREYHPPNPEYSQWVKERLLQGVKQARRELKPATLGFGTGKSWANMNRRAEDVDGMVSLGMNPDRPVDREFGIIRIEKPNGKLMATIVNYAMHGTVLNGENMLVSGGAPGIVAEYVEEKTGAPMLFINGAAGNIAPIYSTPVYSGNYRNITEFNVLLGDKILHALPTIGEQTADVQLSLDRQIIETPRKPGFGWVDELSDYSRVSSTGDTLLRVPISYLQINQDVMIWSIPVEMFNQYATTVREQSPFRYTFFFGYTNGWLGYMPIASAFPEGGYESQLVNPFTTQVEEDITQGVITYLQGIPR